MSPRMQIVSYLTLTPFRTARVNDKGSGTSRSHTHRRTAESRRCVSVQMTPREVEKRKCARPIHTHAARGRVPKWAVLGAMGLGLLVPLAAAASAQAASPWWLLETGSRPTYIQPGSRQPGSPEKQEIVMKLAGGQGVLELGVGADQHGFCEGQTLGCFAYPEALAHEAELPPMDAKDIREALEGPYGAGEVTVTEQVDAAAETVTFVITSPPGSPITVNAGFEIGSPSVRIVAPGQAATPDGEIYVLAENAGDAPVDGELTPITIADQLPENFEAVGIAGVEPEVPGGRLAGPLSCELASLSCTFAGVLPPYASLEVRISVNVEPGAANGEPNGATIEGGEAAAAGISRPIRLSGGPTPFGFHDFRADFEEEGGAVADHAGSHPFQLTTTVALNQGRDLRPLENVIHKPEVEPAALPKDINTKFPPGFIGNPTRFPTCSLAQFVIFKANSGNPDQDVESNDCPADSAVGITSVTLNEPEFISYRTLTYPLFNLEPSFGEPARLGFFVPIGNVPVVLDTSLRSGAGEGAVPGQSEDYGVDVDTTNTSQTAGLLSARVTVWGTPGDPRHAADRGWSCMFESLGAQHSSCERPVETHPPAFLTAPTSCVAPMQASVEADSWNEPGRLIDQLPSEPLPTLVGCNQLPFGPTISSEPTASGATSPTGLNFDIDVKNEGLTNGEGLAASEIKKVSVTLPEGFSTNPSVAEGLKACSLAEFHATTLETGSGCTEESKIGSAEIESPVVSQTIKGSLFVARQQENPYGNLLTLYLVLKSPELGVLVKQALMVTPNPLTGRLTTEVDNIPQLPFSRFHLSFRQGQRSPLVTPPTCGTYTVGADLYPYSNPEVPIHDESSFQITSGPEGQPCPTGVPPFHPNLLAGSENPTAGAYSPFYTEITRKDSEQEITRFSIKLPTGEIAKLKGVSECSDAQVAAAKAREREGGGAEEEASPSCPANSLIGHSDVGTGVGNVLAYAPGKLYLAGPYHGSPISLVSITAAKVGPFDLGTVVVRFALDVNHETAEVSVDGANSDPIPHIVDGIPVHLRDIQAFVDRPGFTLNPTSCAKKSTAATVLGSGANFASSADDVPVTISSPFQVASCASLGFKPKLALSLTGKKTHRGALPAFKAVLTYPKQGNYANIAKAQVTLPESEYLEQGHLKDVCTRKVFETGKVPGENCPPKSIYGKARAVTPLLDQPLEGPVYLRTGYGTKLPELAAALNGPQIDITLAGKIDSVHKKGTEGSRIRNTFSVVPDAPVERFTLELRGGKKGLLVNSTDVCKGTHRALAAFTGQNGKLDEYEPALKAQCGGKGKKGSGAKKKGKGGK